jgi:hypothetical protein
LEEEPALVVVVENVLRIIMAARAQNVASMPLKMPPRAGELQT